MNDEKRTQAPGTMEENTPGGAGRRRASGGRAEWRAEGRGDWYRQAVEAAPNPILLIGPNGCVQDWNPASERLIDADGLEGRGVDAFLRLGDETPVSALVTRSLEGEILTGVEIICRNGDGSERLLLSELYPAHSPDGERIVGCIMAHTDVTERARHEEELRHAKEAAEEAVRLKSTILNNLSHEIRTPLTAILGFAELLAEEVAPEQREFVQLIQSSSKRLMGTLVSVLELARLESGDMRLSQERLDLCAEAAEVGRMLRSQAEEKGLRLEVLSLDEPFLVQLDSLAVNRILGNLVTNAIKFTFSGYVRVEVGREEGRPFLRVTDTGIGVSDEFKPFLFDEFKQESAGYARRHEGAGLGLAITRRLVEVMGGRIEVESEKDRGSTFTVHFPEDVVVESD